MKKLFISLFFISFASQLLAIKEIEQQLIDIVQKSTPEQLHNDLNIINLLLKEPSIDINAKDTIGYTALMWAVLHNKLAIVKRLLEDSKIDIYTENMYGDSALTIAHSFNNNIARLLISSKHFDLDKLLETIPEIQYTNWFDYISEEQEIIAQEKQQKLVQKHCCITNYLQQRELGQIKPKLLL